MDTPINYTEPHELQMLRDQVRRFVDDHMPREKARAWDKDNISPAMCSRNWPVWA